MVTLRKIHIQDFLSHQETILTLEEGDKVLLDGVSGSGKSSIIDALIWNLYGVGRVDNRSLIRKGSRQAIVSVELASGEDTFDIERQITSTGRHVLSVTKNGAGQTAGTKETQSYIENDILHCSYELFINSVAYPQGNRESFVNATSARRKELLLEILKTEDISALAEKTKEIISSLFTDRVSLEREMDAARMRMEQNDAQLVDEPEIETALGNLVEFTKDYEVAVDGLKEKHSKLLRSADGAEKVKSLRGQAESVQARIWKIKRQDIGDATKEGITEALASHQATIIDEEETSKQFQVAQEWAYKRSAILADRPDVRDYDSEIAELETRLHKHVDEQPDCPSGNECPYMKTLEPETAYLKGEIEKKIESRNDLHTRMGLWQNRIDELGEAPDLSGLQEKMKNIQLAHTAIRVCESKLKSFEEVATLSEDLTRLTKEADELEKDFPTAEAMQTSKEELESKTASLERFRDDISAMKVSLGMMQKLREQQVDLLFQLKKDEGKAKTMLERFELLSELREAFGTNGIQAVALDYLLPALEDRINGVLSQLSDFRVRLDTQRASATKDATVEGLFITIRNEAGEEFSFDSYSGGEKLKITVAISEALATLQNIGFRILDELFVGLDADSTDSFANVLGQIQGRFSQMLCISHLQQIKDVFEKRIVIRKLDNVSRVEL